MIFSGDSEIYSLSPLGQIGQQDSRRSSMWNSTCELSHRLAKTSKHLIELHPLVDQPRVSSVGWLLLRSGEYAFAKSKSLPSARFIVELPN